MSNAWARVRIRLTSTNGIPELRSEKELAIDAKELEHAASLFGEPAGGLA